MTNPLINDLNNINSLTGLSDFISQLEAKDIGLLGGRKFIAKSGEKAGELSLNDIVRKFENLKDKISQEPEKALIIRRQIHRLDEQANSKLAKKNILTRILTSIRSTLNPPKETVTGLFSHAWTRQEVLLDLAGALKPDSSVQHQYITEEIFDEYASDMSQDLKAQGLRKALVQYSAAPTAENLKALFESIHSFNKRGEENLALAQKDEQILSRLIYKYRFSNKYFIRNGLAAALLAAYNKAKHNPSDLISPTHPMQRLTAHVYGEETWHLKKDRDLMLKAQEILINESSDI